MAQPPLTPIEARIRDLLRAHPDGLDIKQIRDLLALAGDEHQHLDRRLRGLRAYYEVPGSRKGRRYIYRLGNLRPESEWRAPPVSATQRARILHRDGMRCGMCGRTVAEDGVRLHIDHKIPLAWGGESVDENLWALCSECNEGKQAHFQSLDTEAMSEVLSFRSVHARLAHTLKHYAGEWVDSETLQFVANFNDYQEDWQKRLRELRYFGLEIEVERRRYERRTRSAYRLNNWVDLPEDPTAAAREYERNRALRNRQRRENG